MVKNVKFHRSHQATVLRRTCTSAQWLTLWGVSRVQRHVASETKKTDNSAFMCFLVWGLKLCVLGPTEIFYFPRMEVLNIFIFNDEWWLALRGKYRALAVITKSVINVFKCNYSYYPCRRFFCLFFCLKKWVIKNFQLSNQKSKVRLILGFYFSSFFFFHLEKQIFR